MKNATIIRLPLLFTLGLSVACAPSGDADTPPGDLGQASDAVVEGSEGPSHARPHHGPPHRGPHARGPHRLLGAALHELDLTDTQRATVDAELRALRDLRRDFQPEDVQDKANALAAAVRAGRVDPDAFDGGDIEAEMKAAHARVVLAVDKLHATLTPEQRSALVDAVDARRGPPRGRRARGPRGPMRFMLRGLDLTEEQRATIQDGLEQQGTGREARREERRAQRSAVLKAFATDDFDAATDLPPPPAEMARGPAKLVEALAVIVPILDDEQREQLAQRIEEGPRKRRRGRD